MADDKEKRLKVVRLDDPLTNDQMADAGQSAGNIFNQFQLWGTGDVVLIWQSSGEAKKINIATFQEKNPLVASLVAKSEDLIRQQKG